jgi:hypothetical protein
MSTGQYWKAIEKCLFRTLCSFLVRFGVVDPLYLNIIVNLNFKHLPGRSGTAGDGIRSAELLALDPLGGSITIRWKLSLNTRFRCLSLRRLNSKNVWVFCWRVSPGKILAYCVMCSMGVDAVFFLFWINLHFTGFNKTLKNFYSLKVE